MSCERWTDRLDGYVDGTLAPSTARRVSRHLEECAACRDEERELRRLVSELATLPTSIAPARDLWDDLAARIEVESTDLPHPGVATAWRRGLLAATVLIALLGAGYLMMTRDAAPPIAPPGDAPATPASMNGTAPVPRLGEAELAFVEAARHLRAALAERRPSLPASTVRTIDDNLAIIEEAVEAIRKSLAADPGNRELEKMLVAARQREVDFLQSVTQRAARM